MDSTDERYTTPARRSPAAVWRGFWSAPGGSALQAGGAGELVVARVRVLVVFILLVLSIETYIQGPGQPGALLRLQVAGAAMAIALTFYLVLKRVLYRFWIGMFTGVLDITLVSAGLALYLSHGVPHAAVNSLVVFPVYFLALAGTGIRLDHRAPVVIGLAALVEYGAIVAYAATRWDLNDPSYAPYVHGMFDLGSQIGRLLLLGCAGFVGTIVVRRVQRARLLTAIDPLTGLMNRRAFEERLQDEYARARRYGRPISIAMIDIDYFKQFNDTYGHAAGDEALRAVARTIRGRLRKGDVFARYGGEEFVIVLPETPAPEAMSTASLLRRTLASQPVRLHGYRDPVPVTVSIGVASWPEHGTEISRLLDRADDRLYEAKLAGRDRVVGPAVEPALV
ncbi:MAG: GGDEF domain-containing protein [Gemmatimonadota bacterium]